MKNKYVKLDDLKELLRKLNNEPQYQHNGETYYAGIAAVDMELDTLTTVELDDPVAYMNKED